MSSSINSSSIPFPTSPPSSTQAPTREEAYYNQYAPPKPLTVAQINAQGDVKLKFTILLIIGICTILLIIIGGVSIFINPEYSKDVWVVLGPIISSAITSPLAYLVGEKSATKK